MTEAIAAAIEEATKTSVELGRRHATLDLLRAAAVKKLNELHPDAEVFDLLTDGISIIVGATGGGAVLGTAGGRRQHVGSGGGEVQITWEEVALYLRDPLQFCASLFEMNAADYVQYVGSDGAPQCAAVTKSGRLCKNLVGRIHLRPQDWQTLHRKVLCSIHDRDPAEGDRTVIKFKNPDRTFRVVPLRPRPPR